MSAIAGLAFAVPLATHAASADLRADTLGETYTLDLFRGVPAAAIVMGSGDAFRSAASYACSVEHLCEGRAVFSPGQLHLPWAIAQLERRDPWLVLPGGEHAWPRAHEIVAANFGAHPVLLGAKLLDLDPPLRERFGFLPGGLLLRAMPDAEVAGERATFLVEARAMLEPSRCRGCQLGAFEIAVSPLERALAADYALALDNHARILTAVFDDASDAVPLDLRAHTISP